MKISSKCKLREVAGEAIVVNQGEAVVNMARILSLNASARWLYGQLQGKEFSVEEAADLLVAQYGISRERALQDAGAWVDSLKQGGVLE